MRVRGFGYWTWCFLGKAILKELASTQGSPHLHQASFVLRLASGSSSSLVTGSVAPAVVDSLAVTSGTVAPMVVDTSVVTSGTVAPTAVGSSVVTSSGTVASGSLVLSRGRPSTGEGLWMLDLALFRGSYP